METSWLSRGRFPWITFSADDAAVIVRTAAWALSGWMDHWLIYGEIPKPLRLFLDRLEE
jgi:hypothetical protein